MRLPRFNGNRRDWEAFKEKFSTLIVDDPSLAPIIKLEHLTNCLEGEAVNRLRGIQQSAANFETAWQTLCCRYDNKYLRFKAQLQLLANILPAAQETEADLSQILNIVNESINVFESLTRPIEHWDDLLIYFVEYKLPAETRRDWAKEMEQKFKEFIEGRLKTLDVVEMEKKTEVQSEASSSDRRVEKSNKLNKKYYFNKKGKSTSINVAMSGKVQNKMPFKCSFCQGDHFLSYCMKFTRCSQEERKAHVTAAGFCFNCLQSGHRLNAYTSKHRCFVCGELRHTKLHGASNTTAANGNLLSQEATTAHAAVMQSTRQAPVGSGGVLLATACVILQAPSGQCMTVRALLNSRAEESFLSEYVSKALRLAENPAHVVVSGVGVLSKLTAALPSQLVTLPPWLELKELKLADPGLCAPRRIDCILNSEAYTAALQPGIKRGPCGSLVALQSVFGWVLMGATGTAVAREEGSAAFHITVDQNLSKAVCWFWELEEVPRKQLLAPDEQECYEHFKSTHGRDATGGFVVRLPFRKPPVLKDTRPIAERCLLRLERRLQRDPKLAEAYADFMDEYLHLHHLEIVPESEIHHSPVYYLPHHPVMKSDGRGKIRVVFNASQFDSEGNSLNTFLHTGAKLQEDVVIIIIRWAFKQVAFTYDIKKMFRQYRLDPRNMNWLRILWRFKLDGPILACRLSTVTYGTGCAPFIANACLLQLADDEREQYPEAAQVLEEERYVDDFFTGTDELEEAIQLKEQLFAALATAGLQLGKCASNRPEILSSPEEKVHVELLPEEEHTMSTLGLYWNTAEDVFVFKIKDVPTENVITKRVILSSIARLYDPIGWLAPFIIRSKILLQNLWMRGADWDTPVPSDLRQAWVQFREQIPQVERIKIPRWFGTTASSDWHLHAFCDASERAYAAAIYIVVKTEKGTISQLMTVKSKGWQELARQPVQIHCWTDSKVALALISAHPSRWKTFVANRVSEIHEKLPAACWRHVRSADNPADLATRGLTPEQLRDAAIWWRGPTWICEDERNWPVGMDAYSETTLESKVTSARTALTENEARNEKRKGWLTAFKLALSKVTVIKVVQAQVYAAEIKEWTAKGVVSHSSSIRRLSPFVDQHGMLRAGGHLQNAFLTENEKHPVIMPAKNHVKALIVAEAHILTLHGGPTLVQSFLSQRYWIVRSRNFVRAVRSSVRCTRLRAETLEQQMGPLPAMRTQPSRTFAYTGVDYAGSFLVKASAGRGQKCFKGYVSVFVCTVLRAVHLEVVSVYTSSAFLAAFRRFTGRRGTPTKVFSDNATNFKGADAELQRLFSEASAVSQELAAELARDGIEWSYTPPRSPNFGGLWEASVKSFKFHYKRVVGEAKLTFEEFSTLTVSIEACLNSRPISVQSFCEEDSAVFTPGHFLIGGEVAKTETGF